MRECESEGMVDWTWSGLSMGRRRGNRAGTGSTSVTVHGASMGLVAYTGQGSGGTDRMRGDGVGVGDI